MRIGLDIDGVMYKWDKTARYMLRDVLPNSPYKTLLQQESQGWDWIKDNVTPEHWQWLWTEGIRLGLFRYGHLYPGTIQAVRRLAELGDVVLITHRPREAVTETCAWLGLLNLPISGLHLLTSQEPKSIVLPQCDVYLDDKPANVEELAANTPARLVCLMRRPWNSRYLPWPERIREVYNWDEFIHLVEEVGEGKNRIRPGRNAGPTGTCETSKPVL
jgi:uncharacterized HAD superfamily protein